MVYARFATRLCLWGLLAGWLIGATPVLSAEAVPAPFVALPAPLPLPAVVVKDMLGRETTLAELVAEKKRRAKRVVLHLWAPSCPSCVPEIIQMDERIAALRESGVEVIALAEDPNGAVTVPGFARRRGLRRLPLYIDPYRYAMLQLKGRGVPTSYLIDDQNQISAIHEEAMDWAAFPPQRP